MSEPDSAEALSVTGTNYSLHYASDRTLGRTASNTLQISLSEAAIPVSLKRIDLQVLVAGQYHSQSFPAAPNQSTGYSWDGKDVYERVVQGMQLAKVRIGYVYNFAYQVTPRFGSIGGGGVLARDGTRQEITLWQTQYATIGPWD